MMGNKRSSMQTVVQTFKNGPYRMYSVIPVTGTISCFVTTVSKKKDSNGYISLYY
jgi:hypothetical protein